MPSILTAVVVALSLAQTPAAKEADGPKPPELTAKERLYQHICYTGVAMAQAVLPKVDAEDELMIRGFRSCDGSLLRMRPTGEIEKEKNLVEFGCGYAIGATFAKYGLGAEADPPSPRFIKAALACRENLAKQGVK